MSLPQLVKRYFLFAEMNAKLSQAIQTNPETPAAVLLLVD